MMLLDTSGLFSLHLKREQNHPQACQMYNAANIRVTHNYVLAEFVALANARRIPRERAIIFVRDLLHNPDIEMIWIDKLLHRDAIQLLLARLDKSYSLCDAVSFLIMRQRYITEALTTDHHFEQEGFQRLLT